jgi:biopolymer transport protein ExbB/TolQ
MNATAESLGQQMNRARATAILEMKRGFGVLAATATTAPLLGFLLGCRGLVAAFPGGSSGKEALFFATMSWLGDALLPMAVGVTVAIPAARAFHSFTAQVERLDAELIVFVSALTDALAGG